MATKEKDPEISDIEASEDESENDSEAPEEVEETDEEETDEAAVGVDEEEVDEEEADETVDEDEEESEVEEVKEGTDEDEEPGEGTKKKKKTKRTAVSNIGIEMLKTNKKTTHVTYDDDDEDDENDDDTNYLQKFDNKMRDNFILNHHPESRTHNYEEVKALTRVTRDSRGIIIDPLHKTIPFLTKYEMTRVIGQRAKQLDSGAKAFVKVPINVIDGYLIALLELEQKKLPFIIKRPYPNGGVEYWNVSDLEMLL